MLHNHKIAKLLYTTAFLLAFLTPSAFALEKERILDFNSNITVSSDASMLVQETIEVKSTGENIKHGIYRDFPTTYKDRYGNRFQVAFDLIDIKRNGTNEAYHTNVQANGIRIYLGSKYVELPPGIYTYQITYRTQHQLGFFKAQDELYWNVTGNGWSFPIDHAAAKVILPGGIAGRQIKTTAYTGKQGSIAQDYTSKIKENQIYFDNTRSFLPGEGLTIVVGWPKGFVKEPTAQEKARRFTQNNLSLLLALLGLLVVTAYYLAAWKKVGKDPAKGVIIPEYAPPTEFSPAVTRFIFRMGYDDKTFACALVSMAVKKYLTIQEEKGVYTLKRAAATESVLSADEKALAGVLFGLINEVELKTANHHLIKSAIDALKNSLQKGYEKLYFNNNRAYFISGILLSGLFLLLAIASINSPHRDMLVALSAWVVFWSCGVFFIIQGTWQEWNKFLHGKKSISNFISAVLISIVCLPFTAAEVMVLGIMAYFSSPFLILVLLLLAGTNWLFYYLLKAPTLLGRKLLDKFEGFKMYLAITEASHLQAFQSPTKTPELFEKYFPYAMALEVEEAWSGQFKAVLADSQYTPHWYAGTIGLMSGGSFTSALGTSLSTAITSSSSPPGSSSGTGGGGSSGGGGGGGGGGW